MNQSIFPKAIKENWSEKFPYVYEGIVTDHIDPLGLDRVRVRVVGIHSGNTSDLPDEDCPFAEVVAPFSMFISPKKGDWVWIQFRNGDPMRPIVLGEIKSVVPGEVGGGSSGPGKSKFFDFAGSSSGGSGNIPASEIQKLMEEAGIDLSTTTFAPGFFDKFKGQINKQQQAILRGCEPELIDAFAKLNAYMISLGYKGLVLTDGLRYGYAVEQYKKNPEKFNFDPSGKGSFHKWGMAFDCNILDKNGYAMNTERYASKEPAVIKAYKQAADFWHALGSGYRWGGPSGEEFGKGDFQWSKPGWPSWISDMVHFDLGGGFLNSKYGGSKKLKSVLINKKQRLLGQSNDEINVDDNYYDILIKLVKTATGDDITKSDIHRGALRTKYKWLTINKANGEPLNLYKTKTLPNNLPKNSSFGTYKHSPINALQSGTGFNSSNQQGFVPFLNNKIIDKGQPTTDPMKWSERISNTIIGNSMEKIQNVFLLAGGGYKQEPKMIYDAEYPLSWGIHTHGGNYIFLNDKKDYETVTLGNKTLSFIQINNQGSINLNAKRGEINLSCDAGVMIGGSKDVQISSNATMGILSETSFYQLSGVDLTKANFDTVHFTGTKGHFYLIQETKDKKRFCFSFDPEHEEFMLTFYPEKNPDKMKRHSGSLKPIAYMKINKDELILSHEKAIKFKSPSVQKETFSPTADMVKFHDKINDVEPMLTNKSYHTKGID